MTPRAVLVVLAAAAGMAGAAAALLVAGGLGAFGGTTTVQQVITAASAERPQPVKLRPSAALTQGRRGRFDAVALYEARAGGVVTIEAWFGSHPAATGSGFVADARAGLILTNSHVITNSADVDDPGKVRAATRVFVELAGGARAAAEVVGYDLFDDVGVVRVAPGELDLQQLPLGRSRDLAVGEPVAAIGSPFNEQGSLSVGVVSQVGRQIPTPAGVCFETTGAIQTDAAINHGNSGGPLFDARGEVIGINAQIDSSGDGGQGVGFAIPIEAARHSLRELVAHGRVRYAWLGVSTRAPMTVPLARRLGLPVAYGALVDAVTGGSAADDAGLRSGERTIEVAGRTVHPDGDVIVRLGDDDIRTLADLQSAVARHRPGDRLAVRYYRDGRLRTTQLTLGERPLAPRGGCNSLR